MDSISIKNIKSVDLSVTLNKDLLIQLKDLAKEVTLYKSHYPDYIKTKSVYKG